MLRDCELTICPIEGQIARFNKVKNMPALQPTNFIFKNYNYTLFQKI